VGVPGSDADKPWMDGEFTGQESEELLDKQEEGILEDGKADEEPMDLKPERPTIPKSASEKRAALAGPERELFEGLVRLAHDNAEARKPVLAMLCEQGVIDCDKSAAEEDDKEAIKEVSTDKEAGCEKLPEGPMRDNCEKKKSEGDKKDKKAKEKYPWDQCIKDQMKQYGNMETAKKVCGKIKAESQGKKATALREDLIRTAHALPKGSAERKAILAHLKG